MGRTDSRRRALFLLIVFATVGSALLARLAYWQVGQHDRLADEAFQPTSLRQETPSRRRHIQAGIDSKALTGLALEPEPVRVYPQAGGGPNTTLAATLLGFVNREGVGQYGVEQFYQDQLAGRPKIVQAQRDVASRQIPETA